MNIFLARDLNLNLRYLLTQLFCTLESYLFSKELLTLKMPKGMEVRRALLTEMHATMVDIPKGADILEHLNKAADDAGYVPFVVLSAIGRLSAATLRIPNEDALDEAEDIESFMNVEVVEDFENDPRFKDKPIVELVEGLSSKDLPPDFPYPPQREKKPHWSSIQSFDYPLTLLYAIGGRRRPTSLFKYHFILSGSPSRNGGVSESFVGELLPGCIAGSPLQFVVGLATPFTTTVQAWTIAVQPGYDVVNQVKAFIRARQNLGKCFFYSATGGKLLNATVKNVSGDSDEDMRTLEVDQGPYVVESMTAIVNANVEELRIHATIILNCSTPPCEAIGGELIQAIVSEGQSLDVFLGEMIEEQRSPI